ncbi:uncharacterized protein LOC113375081 [Ctenocephalides felis]|uniref:uncharacterized protein LOC113375081 n=1 Tax=Ctenocephalides felis TaxID=7515 RepID=UPI000E6E37E8|nr:uncharacterized protein LOC113375081 [Ctenocephalides felis]
MEVMEEGNLMDRVPILLQRDMQYYQQKQTVLSETICPGVVGGRLDFPRSASFASVKIVTWWEEEYIAAYRRGSGLLEGTTEVPEYVGGCGGIIRASDPGKFVSMITKSADQLLEHLHTLSQEALDHADLAVLTATIGAAALIRNCLFCYLQRVTQTKCRGPPGEKSGSLKVSHKQYSEMAEALAERLLDLHCRLLSLYILQDADCLDWENPQPFFESERGSYIIQMWWLYMKGTQQDLWTTVPPLMAQRVFQGMLNETLSILTVRYTQTCPSRARADLLRVDLGNLLLCCGELLPAVCESGEAYSGINLAAEDKAVRDIHAKCQELMAGLVLRGAPLSTLYRVFRKDVDLIGLFKSRGSCASPWIVMTNPHLFSAESGNQFATRMLDLTPGAAIALELKVYLAQPQPTWPLLLKLLLMRDCAVSSIILHHLINYLPMSDDMDGGSVTSKKVVIKTQACDGFLCTYDCSPSMDDNKKSGIQDPIGANNCAVVASLIYVLLITGRPCDLQHTIVSALDKCRDKTWADCLDKTQMWNQRRPPWLEATLNLIYPIIQPIVQSLCAYVHNGSSMYQAMSQALTYFTELLICLPSSVLTLSNFLTELLPANIHPMGQSIFLQLLLSALYTELINSSEKQLMIPGQVPIDGKILLNIRDQLAEALCYIDEDDKHAQQMAEFVSRVQDAGVEDMVGNLDGDIAQMDNFMLSFGTTLNIEDEENKSANSAINQACKDLGIEYTNYAPEMSVSDVLMTFYGKKCVKILHDYVTCNSVWILQKLGVSEVPVNDFENFPGQLTTPPRTKLLETMFYIRHRPFDQMLMGSWQPDWSVLLDTPLGLTRERAWSHISKRWEFRNPHLSLPDAAMVAHITNKLKI